MRFLIIITVSTISIFSKTVVYDSLKEFCYDTPKADICKNQSIKNINESITGCKQTPNHKGVVCYKESYNIVVEQPKKNIKKYKKINKYKNEESTNNIDDSSKKIDKIDISKSKYSKNSATNKNFIQQNSNLTQKELKKRVETNTKKLSKEINKNIFKMTSPIVVQDLARENRSYSYDERPYLYESNIDIKKAKKKLIDESFDLRLYKGNTKVKQKYNLKKDIYCKKYKFNIYRCNKENLTIYNTITKEKFTGVHYERNANNDIWFAIRYKKGKRIEIKWYLYYGKHLLKAEGVHNSINNTSILTTYYQNQFIKSIEKYKNRQRNGIIKRFYSNGQIARKISYKNNKINGIVKIYYRNGSTNSITHYKNNIKDGEERYFYENAIIAVINHYKDGIANGESLKYDIKGRLYGRAYFKQGMFNGLYQIYYKNGNLKLEVKYINNRKEGIARTYYINGNLKQEVSYIGGEKQGISREYYINGALKFEVMFRNDKILYGKKYNLNKKASKLNNAEISNYNSKIKKDF